MIISTCGFGETGSSAVTDYLKECSGVQVADRFEFTIATGVDGLEDLAYFVMEKCARQGCSIYAIQRFEKLVEKKQKSWHAQTGIPIREVQDATKAFLDSITQVQYVGFSPRINRHEGELIKRFGDSVIRRKLVRKLEKKGVIKKNFDFYPLDRVRMSIRPENFYEEAQRYVNRLLTGMRLDPTGTIAMDQAFSGPNPAKSFPFFQDPYAIVVDRDPRDVYIFAKKKSLSIDRFMPTDTVENYIAYYRLLRQDQPYTRPDPRILSIRFEDLVYEYDATTEKIQAFLGIRNDNPKTVFLPEMSIRNTNLIKKYPEFAEDVDKIERALPEYIFPFENYPEMDNAGSLFYGRSTRNPKTSKGAQKA